MRALVVQQPFADMIANGEKLVENRFWATGHRGPLAIVAGKRSRYLEAYELALYRTGVVVAIVDVLDCVPLAHAPITKHTEGPWCWLLANVRPLNNGPPVRGKPGLFWIPAI